MKLWLFTLSKKSLFLKRQLERDTRLGPNEFDWHSLMLESSEQPYGSCLAL